MCDFLTSHKEFVRVYLPVFTKQHCQLLKFSIKGQVDFD